MSAADDHGAIGRDLGLHGRIAPLGAGLLFAALVTDVFYLRSFSTQWETFSVWLITGGLVVAAVAGLALVIDLIVGRRRLAWTRLLAFTLVVALSVFNAFIHSRDGYTAVFPSGVALSAAVAILLVVLGSGGWSVTTLRPPARR